jgi:hypothetical protein
VRGKVGSDLLLRRSVCAAGQPARPQVSRGIGLSGSDREFPALTSRSGTQRARRLRVAHASWHLGALVPGQAERPTHMRWHKYQSPPITCAYYRSLQVTRMTGHSWRMAWKMQ